MLISALENFFAWLGGSGIETLSKCPDWEIRKHANFGATVLIPTMLGAGACAYAVSTLTNQPILVAGVALLWAFIVLTIDRAFLAAYRTGLPPFQKGLQLFLRLIIAVLMGLAIAHPLVLLIFEGAVDAEIEAETAVRNQGARNRMELIHVSLENQIEGERQRLDLLRQQYQQTFEYAESKNLSEPSESPALAVLNHQLGVLGEEKDDLSGEVEAWEGAYEREVLGKGKSGVPGVGPEARRIREDELAWRKAKVQRLEDSLRSLLNQKNRLIAALADEEVSPERRQLARAQAEAQLAELQAKRKSRESFRESLRGQIVTGTAGIEQLRIRKEAAHQTYEEEIDQPPRIDLISRTLALHRLFEKPGGEFAFGAFVVLTLVFVLMDTIPIVVKFTTKSGPYDLLVEHQEANFKPEVEALDDIAIPEEAAPPMRTIRHFRWKRSGDARHRLKGMWRRTSLARASKGTALSPTAQTHEIAFAKPLQLEQGHVIAKANQLAKMRAVFRSNIELAEAVGIQPSTVSKYFKLLKISESLQQDLSQISDLTLEVAYRIASAGDGNLQRKLVMMAANGTSQKAIRDEIHRAQKVSFQARSESSADSRIS